MAYFIIYFTVWCITAVVALCLLIIHPRFHYAVMLLYSLYKCLKGVKKLRDSRKKRVSSAAEEKTDGQDFVTPEIMQQEGAHFSSFKEIGKTFKHLIYMLAIVCFLGSAQIGWWWHAPYEYKADIRALKALGDRHDFFPDELPEGAKNVHWICRPGVMQGTPAELLYFNTNAEYVQAIRERYENTARIYTYKKDDGMDVGYFEAEDGHDLWYGYLINSLSEEQRKRSVIYETYLTEGNHGRCGGILVDPVDNFVYYFFD